MSTRTRKLPWPCSRIERDVLHDLWMEAQRTRRPLSAVVKDAVDNHLNRIATKAPTLQVRMPAPSAGTHLTVGHAA